MTLFGGCIYVDDLATKLFGIPSDLYHLQLLNWLCGLIAMVLFVMLVMRIRQYHQGITAKLSGLPEQIDICCRKCGYLYSSKIFSCPECGTKHGE